MKLLLLLQSALFVAVLAHKKVRYDNYQVFRVTPTTYQHLDTLKEFESNPSSYSFWTDVSGLNKSVDIMVPPHLSADFDDAMEFLGMQNELYIENVQTLIDEESEGNARAGEGFTGWNKYAKLSEINAWLQKLPQQYPGKVKVVTGGKSYEGRSIIGVHVSFNAANANKAVFIEGGIHAREWISPATVTYFLNEILSSKDAKIRAIADAHDWYIFPVFNPDGYEYTHTTNRMWRKTRVPYGKCYGADPNRNWDYQWGVAGVSKDPCADNYAGPKAFSEPSTKSLSEYIKSISSKLKGYIAFHSYSQLLLIPYGHTAAHLDNYDELLAVGKKAATALSKRYGTQYKVGNIVETIYPASGGSMDWNKGTYKTRVTYTYELRDTGKHGFALPPEQIIPNSLEVLDSLVTIFTEFK